MEFSNYILRPTKTAGDVVSRVFLSHIVPDDAVKFRGPGLNRSREIRLPRHFRQLFTITSDRIKLVPAIAVHL